MVKIKKISLLLILSLVASVSIAQNESFLGLTLGAALPQGTYAEKEYNTEGAGYANTGFLFTFDAAIFPDDFLGFGATVTYGSNNPDKAKYTEDLTNDIISRYPWIQDYEDEIYFDYGVWRYLNFHIGPAFTVPAGNFNFDFRGLAGLSLAWAPDQLFQITGEDDFEFSRRVEDKAVPTLGFTIGAGVRYSLKSGYVLRFIAEYTNCKPTIEVTEDVLESIIDGNEIKTSEIAMPIKNIQLGIGIAYNFEL